MANCPACKAPVVEEDRFCGECGAELTSQETAPSPSLSCPACGAPHEPADRFCPECGRGLKSDENVADEGRRAPAGDDNSLPSIRQLLMVALIGAAASALWVVLELVADPEPNATAIMLQMFGLAFAGCLLAMGLAYAACLAFRGRLSWRLCFYGAIAVFTGVLLIVLVPADAAKLARTVLAAAAGLAVGYEWLVRIRHRHAEESE